MRISHFKICFFFASFLASQAVLADERCRLITEEKTEFNPKTESLILHTYRGKIIPEGIRLEAYITSDRYKLLEYRPGYRGHPYDKPLFKVYSELDKGVLWFNNLITRLTNGTKSEFILGHEQVDIVFAHF